MVPGEVFFARCPILTTVIVSSSYQGPRIPGLHLSHGVDVALWLPEQ